jgi:hypothetical protein
MGVKVSGLVGALAISLVMLSAQGSAAKCDPVADAADIAAAQAAAATCDCAAAENHGQHVSCVAQAVKAAALANPSCGAAAKKCAARSTCGKPGFVTCCRISARGKLKCSTKSSADKCKAPKDGQACVGTTPSCCNACDAGCGGTTTTTTPPTTTTTAAPTTTTSTAPTTTAPTTTTPTTSTTTTTMGSPSAAFL